MMMFHIFARTAFLHFCKICFFRHLWLKPFYHATKNLWRERLQASILSTECATVLPKEPDSWLLRMYTSGHRHLQINRRSTVLPENWTPSCSSRHLSHFINYEKSFDRVHSEKHFRIHIPQPVGCELYTAWSRSLHHTFSTASSISLLSESLQFRLRSRHLRDNFNRLLRSLLENFYGPTA